MSKLLNELLTRKRLWWFGVTVSLVLFILSTILSIILCIAYFYDVGIFWYYFRVCFCLFFVCNAGDKKLIIYIFFLFLTFITEWDGFFEIDFFVILFLIRMLIFCYHFPNVVYVFSSTHVSLVKYVFPWRFLYFSLNSYLFVN